MELFQEGRRKGVRAHAIADVIGLCSRTLRRWGIALAAHGFSQQGCLKVCHSRPWRGCQHLIRSAGFRASNARTPLCRSRSGHTG